MTKKNTTVAVKISSRRKNSEFAIRGTSVVIYLGSPTKV